jgi:predicted nucleic acid-binding protein
MIFVDTSIWIDAFRGRDREPGAQLRNLLDADEVALAAPVRVELLAGAPARELSRLRRVLSALPIYAPTDATWRTLDAWIDRCVCAGERFGFADLLIGGIVAEHGAAIWSKDRDFRRMERLGLVRCHAP